MMPVLYFLAICLIIYVSFIWILPKVIISGFLVKKFNITIRFGRIAWPFILKNVEICKNGYSIHINEIGIRSSFLSYEVTKPLTISIRDIRINKDILRSATSATEADVQAELDGLRRDAIDFRNKKVPTAIINFAQFMAVHVYNISVVLRNQIEPNCGWFLHATASELHMDGSIVLNTKTLIVTAAMTEAQAKLFRQSTTATITKQQQSPDLGSFTDELKQQQQQQPPKVKRCLMEFSFGIQLEMVMLAQGPISVVELQFIMNNSRITIHSGLYPFVRDLKTIQKSPKCAEHRQQQSEFDFDTIAPIVPKKFLVRIDDTTVVAINENNSNDFLVELKSFAWKGQITPPNGANGDCLPTLRASVQMTMLELNTNQEKLFFVEDVHVKGTLEHEVLNLSAKVTTLQIMYHHSDIIAWVGANILHNHRSEGASTGGIMKVKSIQPPHISSLNPSEQLSSAAGGPNNVLEKFLRTVIVKVCAELWNVSVVMRIPSTPGNKDHQNVSLMLTHIKLLLDQDTEPRAVTPQDLYRQQLFNIVLGHRHWSTELMIESLWWTVGGVKESHVNLKKTHIKGSPFFLGICLLKVSSYGSHLIKLDLSVHTLRLEYNPKITQFILDSIKSLKDYKPTPPTRTKPEVTAMMMNRKSDGSGLDYQNIIVSGKLTDFRLFLYNSHETCILLTVSEMSLARSLELNVAKVIGIQAAIQSDRTVAEGEPHIFTNVKTIHFEHLNATEVSLSPQLTVHVMDDAEFSWDSNLHMHIFTLCKEIKEFVLLLKPPPPQQQPGDQQQEPVKPPEKPKKLMKIGFELFAEGSTILGIKISDRHSMHTFLENFYFSLKNDSPIYASVENVFVNIDEIHMGTLKDVVVQQLPELADITRDRMNYENFQKQSNSVWVTQIGVFNIIFPYNHEFSDAFQNEFVSLFKWLKLIHNVKKKEFTVASKLPNDLLIKINEFLVEMSDDPFEVKLRDNYVLLVDEYHHAIERKQLLDEKIQALCSGLLSVPFSKIEELNHVLTVKNSEIYIKRSKKYQEAGPTRTRLLAWIMTDLQIMAMADTAIHGTENVTRMMRDIDNESPWPEEGLEFVTLWCRAVNVSCSEWKFMLRDYPQPMFLVKEMRVFGNLCGAEQVAPRRAKRDVDIEVGHPFGTMTIQRGMTALKFYHDLDMEMEQCIYAFGPCWEPVMAQYNLSFEKISAPSRDPSPVLPFWDKMRLLFHGRMTMIVKQFTVLLHASLDPYNTTEEMELTWNNCGIVWTNAKIMFKGELNICVRTASRYDDCRLLHFPNLKLTFKLNWICLANPNDHHVVVPCAPDKLPEYSSNQEHDSFRAFRSQNLNIWVSFETKSGSSDSDIPTLVLYGSTLRWFESLKLILSGVTRPTRRGMVFNNVRPKKKQLSRHYRKAHLQMSLHRFQVMYWLSHALHRGFEFNGGRVTFSSEHTLTLSPIEDGLIHRTRAEWATVYMNCELNDSEMWLKSVLCDTRTDLSAENLTADTKIVKFYFLSLAKVSYGRETKIATHDKHRSDTPTHKLVIYDLKGAWTKNNRDVAFALFDSFMRTQKLKKNLSTEVLKCYGDGNTSNATPMKARRHDTASGSGTAASSSSSSSSSSNVNAAQSAAAVQQGAASSSKTSHTANSNTLNMLHQLIAEADHKFNVYSDDLSTQTREQQLQGLQACQDADVSHYNWFISLVNSQVLLKGCETSGYVILSAAKSEILQRVHRPVWRDRSLVSKTTWVGSLECMQYYATVSANQSDALLDENIMWLTVANIQEKDRDATVVINEFPDLPHLVGSGQSVGGIVSETVGAININPDGVQQIQLQRIVSRCRCEFFYVSYGDTSIDAGTLMEVPTPPPEDTISPWERQDEPVDAFTLMHHDLDVCTNSLQYAMILDILNNLLLYVEPQRKQALEKLARKRFQLQLSSVEDQKRPIQHLQTEVRSLMSQMRNYEKDIHLIGKARLEENVSEDLNQHYELVQQAIKECKDKLNVQSEELDLLLSCYKESQLSAINKSAIIRKDKPLTVVRANEICFKHAQWRLTEADGQIGIADLILSNFLYTKKSKSDDSVEHLLELGYIRMCNLIPRDVYKEVLCPTEIQRDMPVDQKRVLRVFCREKPPVGGISVKEHFEINVVPITIAITKKFYSTMLKFCFPENTSDPDNDELVDYNSTTVAAGSSSGSGGSSIRSSKRMNSKMKKSANKDSAFYVKIVKDDVEKMKERAEKNKLFIYIKIPEVPVRVSYKGNKEKNIEDIMGFSLVIPTLEYHNVTWTWLDLLLAMKSDSRRVIVSQAIKQKLLQYNRSKGLALTGGGEKPEERQEEEKAKMLFGNRHANENKSQRKVFKFNKS